MTAICSRLRCAALSALLAGTFGIAVAQTPSLDSSFGFGGITAVQTPDNWSFASSLTALRDGSLAIIETVQAGDSGVQHFYLRRLRADGSSDTAFGADGRVAIGDVSGDARNGQFIPGRIFEDSRGRLVLAGTGTKAPDFRSPTVLMRFTREGRLDTSFGTAGATLWTGSKLAASAPCGQWGTIVDYAETADGKILVFGRMMFNDGFGDSRPSCAVAGRLSADGILDESFGASGFIGVLHRYGSGKPLADGTAEVTGFQGDGTGVLRFAVAKLSPAGQLTSTEVSAVQVPVEYHAFTQPDGSVISFFDADAGFGPGSASNLPRIEIRDKSGNLDPYFAKAGVAREAKATPYYLTASRTPDGGVVAESGYSDLYLCVWRSNGVAQDCGTTLPDWRPWRLGLAPDGSFYVAAVNSLSLPGGYAFRIARFNVMAPNVEYFNGLLGHYFQTYDGVEARLIDAGSAGPGWSRTGQSFKAGGTTPVCRFYGTPGIGSNSHFFTINPQECELVKRDPGWTFEGYGFYATPAIAGQCPAPLVAVHRLYNNRAALRDSNHRHIIDLSLADSMKADGWVYEGVALCARP